MQPVREVSRYGTPVRKTGVFLILLLASVVFAAGCGGDEQVPKDSAEEQSTQEQSANAERTEDTGMDKSTAGEGSSQKVTLKLEGDAGTGFSGVCNVGGQEEDLAGETPQSFVYDLPEGQKLDCEIRKSDSGTLKVTLTAPGNNIVQQTNTPGGSINLSFSEGGVTSSTSSGSSSSNSVVQQSSSSSNSVVQQNSSSNSR